MISKYYQLEIVDKFESDVHSVAHVVLTKVTGSDKFDSDRSASKITGDAEAGEMERKSAIARRMLR